MDLDPRHIAMKILGKKTTFETGFRKGKRENRRGADLFFFFPGKQLKKSYNLQSIHSIFPFLEDKLDILIMC
jgi:hypothetical protein